MQKWQIFLHFQGYFLASENDNFIRENAKKSSFFARHCRYLGRLGQHKAESARLPIWWILSPICWDF